jgi:MFS transporter, DHA2 family, multidrug resistance protein
VIVAANIWWVAGLNETATFGQLSLPRLIQGIGLPMFFLPLNQIVLSGIGPRDLASAAGLSNFIRTISGSIATAVSVYLWNRRTDYHHVVLSEHIRPDSPAWAAMQQQLAHHGITGSASLQYADQLISQQASTMGVNDVFYVLTAAFICLIPVVWFARPPFGAPGASSAH